VVIDSRNWEKLNAERRIVRVANRVITRNGRRCLREVDTDFDASSDRYAVVAVAS
jgi:hypothetical protein